MQYPLRIAVGFLTAAEDQVQGRLERDTPVKIWSHIDVSGIFLLNSADRKCESTAGAAGLVFIDFVALGLAERVILQAQVLVLGGYPGIADVHGLPLSGELSILVTEY